MKRDVKIGSVSVVFEHVDGGFVAVPVEDLVVRVARRTMYGYLQYLVEAPTYGLAGYIFYVPAGYSDVFAGARVVSDTTFYRYRRAYGLDRLGRCAV